MEGKRFPPESFSGLKTHDRSLRARSDDVSGLSSTKRIRRASASGGLIADL